MRKPVKTALATAAVTVYFLCPAYRYYIIGTWIGMKIMSDKKPRTYVIAKGTKQYDRLRGCI
ncbi:hypothetical protein J23TS9_06260 [Paenibacillus sp. J23TS9]|uniref:hypothetical protein n=1 Tax=Paenibacillus sp. J23TS9 TaxID=2807193 RepID=UPI001B158053|nr:hypothetical protein [Paenibacillus sp. J23TS9]GIP25496.1 hypothetical protein J23TS9_06260 [Paenibacillus sp. J23TS9]